MMTSWPYSIHLGQGRVIPVTQIQIHCNVTGIPTSDQQESLIVEDGAGWVTTFSVLLYVIITKLQLGN